MQYTKDYIKGRISHFTFDPASHEELIEKVSTSLGISKKFTTYISSNTIKSKTAPLVFFKTNRPDDFSLNYAGFIAILDNKIYQTVYTTEISKEEIKKPSTLILLNKICDFPYFLLNNKFYYFDETFHSQINFYGSLDKLIELYKKS